MALRAGHVDFHGLRPKAGGRRRQRAPRRQRLRLVLFLVAAGQQLLRHLIDVIVRAREQVQQEHLLGFRENALQVPTHQEPNPINITPTCVWVFFTFVQDCSGLGLTRFDRLEFDFRRVVWPMGRRRVHGRVAHRREGGVGGGRGDLAPRRLRHVTAAAFVRRRRHQRTRRPDGMFLHLQSADHDRLPVMISARAKEDASTLPLRRQ